MPFKGTKRPFASLLEDAITDVHNLVDEAIHSHAAWLDSRKQEVLRLTSAPAPSSSSSSSSSLALPSNGSIDVRMNALLDEAANAG